MITTSSIPTLQSCFENPTLRVIVQDWITLIGLSLLGHLKHLTKT